jgi:hypothetical protein
MKIVLSYRRADSAGFAGRIFDRLVLHFGPESVFMDIDNIPFGIDFRKHISQELASSDVVLVIIGRHWLGEEGRRRLEGENDLVRIEVETALKREIPVIPVLVDGATMPEPEMLPESLSSLAFRNAAQIDSGRDFHVQVDRLIRSIDRLVPRPKDDAHRAERAAPRPIEDIRQQDLVRRSVNSDLPPATETNPTARRRSALGWFSRPSLTWAIVIAACGLTLCLYVYSRISLVAEAETTAELLATLAPTERVHLRRRIPAPPPPPPPPPPQDR